MILSKFIYLRESKEFRSKMPGNALKMNGLRRHRSSTTRCSRDQKYHEPGSENTVKKIPGHPYGEPGI